MPAVVWRMVWCSRMVWFFRVYILILLDIIRNVQNKCGLQISLESALNASSASSARCTKSTLAIQCFDLCIDCGKESNMTEENGNRYEKCSIHGVSSAV